MSTTTAPTETALSQLQRLEAESIHIFRETAAEGERPVLHVDTGHNFPEVLEFRDRTVEELHIRLEVAKVQDYIEDGRLTERPDGTRNQLQTVPLLDAITEGRHDVVYGGARRDEEKARAKERIISLRDEFGQWDPRNQRPELWSLYNTRHRPGEHVRVFPLSNWTELDIWSYITEQGIELPSLYYAHERDVVSRDGMWLAVGEHVSPREGETVQTRTVRYRTVGDMSCTGAVESPAATAQEVLAEVRTSTLTERGATRADDRVSEAAMEDRKREGYF